MAPNAGGLVPCGFSRFMMTFTLTFAWWWIPTAITLVGLAWALFFVDDGGGMFSGIGNLFALIPVLTVSAIAWAIAGALK